MSSANYAIKWDVTDGGGNSSSANYIVEAATGQPTAIGESSSSNYTMVAGFEAAPDSDADTIRNTMDNCNLVTNVIPTTTVTVISVMQISMETLRWI